MFEDFHRRAECVQKLLHDPATSFLVVSSSSPAGIREASAFYRELEKAAFNFSGFILNRSLYDENSVVDFGNINIVELLRSAGAPEEYISMTLAEKLWKNWKVYNRISLKFEHELQLLKKNLSRQAALVQIPLFERDIHDIGSLLEFAALLWD